MDLVLLASLAITLAISVAAESHCFKGKADWVTRALRSLGIYLGILSLVSYYAYLLQAPLNPVYLPLLSGAAFAILRKFSPAKGETDFGRVHALPALIIVAAVAFLYLLPSLPGFLPISYGVDAYWHVRWVGDYAGNLESGRAPFYSPSYGFNPWVYPFSFHITAALHSVASGIPPLLISYPFAVILIAISAIALERIIYARTSSILLSTIGGVALVSSNFTWEVLWGNGTYSQIFAEFAVLLFALELAEYARKRELLALVSAAFCAQLALFAHSFFALIPAVAAPIAILALGGSMKEKASRLAIFFSVAVLVALPYFVPLVQNSLGMESGVDQVLGGFNLVTQDALVSHAAFENIGLPLLLVFVFGIVYFAATGRYSLGDDWGTRAFFVATAALLAGTWVAARYFGMGWYWHYKLYFLAIYAFVAYGVLVIQAIAAGIGKKFGGGSPQGEKTVAIGVILLAGAAWILLPPLSGGSSIASCGNPDKVLNMDQYAVLKNVSGSPGISKVAIVSSYISSFYWHQWVANKTAANNDLPSPPEPAVYVFRRYYTNENGFCAKGVVDPNALPYLIQLLERADNQTAIFVSNYSLVTGMPLGNSAGIAYGNARADVFARSGDAVAFLKR